MSKKLKKFSEKSFSGLAVAQFTAFALLFIATLLHLTNYNNIISLAYKENSLNLLFNYNLQQGLLYPAMFIILGVIVAALTLFMDRKVNSLVFFLLVLFYASVAMFGSLFLMDAFQNRVILPEVSVVGFV
jgi:hypothetical protein